MGTTKGNNAKAALVESLNTLLADYFTLYMKTKNFHWHVAGPDFRDLHLLFDEQGAELYALTDVIAERVRKNGGDTLTSIASIAKATRVKEELRTDIAAKAMAKELRDDNARLVAWIREAKQAAADAGDNATEGMADDWTDQAERRVWFLSQIIA